MPYRRLTAHSETDHEIVVVGAGFSGIGAGIRLKKDGFSDFVLLERAAEPGGAWRDNTYPGVAVDVSSLCYSFSFAPNPAWSRVFAPGSEIREYAGQCADRYGLRAHMRFTTGVVEARFDDAAYVWRLRTTRGPLAARHLVTACGTLTEPRWPDLEGLDAFTGPQLHTARWDPSVPLRGRRVAVIGTGASGVQVVPALAALAGRLYVFQRTARWVLPRPDGAIPRWLTALFRRAPHSQAALRLLAGALTELAMATGAGRRRPARALRRGLEWVCRRHLERQVADPALRGKLTPAHPFGARRPCVSSDYFPALGRANVELVTEPVARVTEGGIRTVDGRTRSVDALVMATGFRAFAAGVMPPFAVVGRGGRELGRHWSEHGYEAYEGVSVPEFPNFFLVLGPCRATGASWFTMVEAQAAHAARCLGEARRRGATTVEVRREAHAAFAREMRRRHGCEQAARGAGPPGDEEPFLRPSSGLEVSWRSRHFPLGDYRFL